MNKTFDIDNSKAVVFTNQLEKIRVSAVPMAVRETLNSAAFDVKKNTMPKSADREFINRAPNFFKANSSVEMASGFDITGMAATVGFIGKSGNKTDKAVSDLEAQEYGGTIQARAFIPMDTARGGNIPLLPVRPGNRIGSINNVVNSNTIEGQTPQQKFQHAAGKAGKGGFVMGNNEKKTLFKVVDVGPDRLKVQPLFSYKSGRDVDVEATRFMRDATEESANKMDDFYIKAATKQIERIK
jgi:hypothetical protein